MVSGSVILVNLRRLATAPEQQFKRLGSHSYRWTTG